MGPAHQNGYASLASPVDWAYDSESDSDAGRPEPDVVLDDLASRRFRSPSPVPPTNYAVPMSPRLLGTPPLFSSAPNALRKTVAFLRSETCKRAVLVSALLLLRDCHSRDL